MNTDTYYAYLFDWVKLHVSPLRPAIIGVNGPQGSGKTSLTRALVARFIEEGRAAIALSVDDFYLTRTEQVRLAEAHAGNPYLAQRGYPGTHDTILGSTTLDRLVALGPGETARVPRYEKSAHAGRGDRAPEPAWPEVTGPLDVIFFEGWMLGFSVPDRAPGDPALAVIDRELARYAAWNRRLSAFVQLTTESPTTYIEWRTEAERAMRARGEGAMTDADVIAYARSFLPAYTRYVPWLETHPPAPAAHLVLTLDEARLPIHLP
jgi:D-glycerate 3-kinase